MRRHRKIGLVGDYDASVQAHLAIPVSLQLAGSALDATLTCEWVPTDSIRSTAVIEHFDGLWCVPASPYQHTEGALMAIGWARAKGVPFLGTCGGFQHLVIEYARNVLGWIDADHAETNPASARAVIAPLTCALIEATETLRLFSGSKLAAIYGTETISETYHCRYGLNPHFAAALLDGPLRASAADETAEIRAVELNTHPFFIGTLFQPERAALRQQLSPVARAFVQACLDRG
jgi:CTP synthase (UTP-ammonia lyase)